MLNTKKVVILDLHKTLLIDGADGQPALNVGLINRVKALKEKHGDDCVVILNSKYDIQSALGLQPPIFPVLDALHDLGLDMDQVITTASVTMEGEGSQQMEFGEYYSQYLKRFEKKYFLGDGDTNERLSLTEIKEKINPTSSRAAKLEDLTIPNTTNTSELPALDEQIIYTSSIKAIFEKQRASLELEEGKQLTKLNGDLFGAQGFKNKDQTTYPGKFSSNMHIMDSMNRKYNECEFVLFDDGDDEEEMTRALAGQAGKPIAFVKVMCDARLNTDRLVAFIPANCSWTEEELTYMTPEKMAVRIKLDAEIERVSKEDYRMDEERKGKKLKGLRTVRKMLYENCQTMADVVAKCKASPDTKVDYENAKLARRRWDLYHNTEAARIIDNPDKPALKLRK